ncbi:Polyadenylate-binding protein, cytoplasmic and nuclear [Cucumispora dikerogammari]|nr:Polyadenylate-binding protein, cytoplasmic and nuclear [Cucumispora dikerogammari]
MARQNSTLILKNLNDSTDIEMLLKAFKSFGALSGIRIRPSKLDKSVIFGFIEYKTNEDATKALEEFRSEPTSFKINGSEIEMDYAHPQFSPKVHNKPCMATVQGINVREIEDKELINLLGCFKLNQKKDNIVAYYKKPEDLKKAQEEPKTINGKRLSITKIQ